MQKKNTTAFNSLYNRIRIFLFSSHIVYLHIKLLYLFSIFLAGVLNAFYTTIIGYRIGVIYI